MGVDRMSFDEPVISLGPVCGSAGPIGNVVTAAQPNIGIQAPVNAPAPARGMA